MKLVRWAAALALLTLFSLSNQATAWDPLPVSEDPLVRMPGTQPADGVSLESPNRCLNCHAGYNPQVEPGFNWQGSMMAQSARDPLFWATVAVAAQDSIWAAGRPNATDICLRCHMPKGWLEGRSDPTNASAMSADDYDGVQCDFCHRMYDPFHADTADGTREGADWEGYWDETDASGSPSGPAAADTLAADRAEGNNLNLFNGSPMYGPDGRPAQPGYVENGAGQYFVATEAAKRASFADAEARHQMYYSRHHKSKYFCNACHDVSNPVLANLGQAGDTPLTTESDPGFAYYHVERTFSEFMLSAYGQQGGAAGEGPFTPASFTTSLPGNYIGKCQDCHMRDVVGVGANKNGTPVRPGDSTEHPQSGQPLHDLTGGNVFVSRLLASAVPGSPNYDAINDGLLNQGRGVLAMDLVSGQGVDPEAMLAGADRAHQQLQLAARVGDLSYDPATGQLGFRIYNQTGHKLLSGYPEGRRMFVNVRAYDSGGGLIYEVNPYDEEAATLRGLTGYGYSDPYPDGAPLAAPTPLGPGEVHVDALVYEARMASALTGEEHTFHFALATGREKDNRIPPKGFRIAEATARMVTPVWHGLDDPAYFTSAEYGGGYDEVSIGIIPGADRVEVTLYYQSTSREYVTFLSDEIDGRASTLSGTGAGGDSAYLAQSDPFFDNLRAWGETIWRLWKHNRTAPGAAPVVMASASFGGGGGGCTAPAPELLAAQAAHNLVTLTWSDEHSLDPGIVGYSIYYDQAGKAQLVESLGLVTGYTDTGLTDGQQYCYKVSAVKEGCESAYSNILCATPEPDTQGEAVVSQVETGLLETAGKGKNQVTTFTAGTVFSRGDTVTFRVSLTNAAGDPLEGGSVSLAIAGPEQALISSGATDSSGVTYAQWSTAAPNRKGNGGTAAGDYTGTVSDVTANGHTWDGVAVGAGFQLQ